MCSGLLLLCSRFFPSFAPCGCSGRENWAFDSKRAHVIPNKDRLGPCGNQSGQDGSLRVFVSNYEASLDSKGRVSVPAPFRHALEGGTRIYLWPASDGSPCLEGGGDELMELYQQTLSRMSPNAPERRVLMHRIVTKSADLKLDETGRIKIPDSHLAMAGIRKDMIFAGAMDRFHIWDPERFAAFDAQMDGMLGDVQGAIEGPFKAALAAGGVRGIVGGREA